MNWNSWSEFFAMGGYALYVWGSFGVVFGALAIELMLVRQRANEIRHQLVRARIAQRTGHGGQR